MSVRERECFVDTQQRVVWIGYEGDSRILAANLKSYCLEAILSPFATRVGFPYAPGLVEADRELFKTHARSIVELLTTTRCVRKGEELPFAQAASFVQSAQEHLKEAAS